SNNNDVTVEIGAPTYNQAGQIAYAVEFDGTNDAFTIPHSADWAVTDFTIEAWGEPDVQDIAGFIVNHYDGATTDGYLLRQAITLTGRWDGVTYVAGGNVDCESDAAPTTNWESVAFTRDGILNELFIDGAVQADDNNLGGAIDSTSLFHIGQHNSGAVRFDGKLDEIRFSDSARNDAWLKAGYYSGDDNLLTWGGEEPFAAFDVDTIAADTIEDVTANLKGDVVDDNGETVQYTGFVWDDDADAGDPGNVDPSTAPGAWDWGWKSALGDYGENPFNHGVAALPAGTTIHFRQRQ
ncbi:unnamed protein product, partial [marine sediment metagenome]